MRAAAGHLGSDLHHQQAPSPLGREKNAGREYSQEQLAWLTAIRDHLAVNAEVTRADLQDMAVFAGRGGLVKARELFGARLDDLLGDLSDALVA